MSTTRRLARSIVAARARRRAEKNARGKSPAEYGVGQNRRFHFKMMWKNARIKPYEAV